MEPLFKYDQLAKVRDRISGFEGTIVARHEYSNGCKRYTLVSRATDGKPFDYTIDEQDVELLKDAPEREETSQRRATGGPQDAPPGPTR